MKGCSNCRWSFCNAPNLRTQFKHLNGQGCDAIISFGGWTGDNGRPGLGIACSSASVAATEIEKLVTYLSASRLDLDIEPDALSNHIDVEHGNSALARFTANVANIMAIDMARRVQRWVPRPSGH